MAQWFVEPRHLDAATMNSVTQHQDAQDDSSERQPLVPKSDFSLPPVDGGKEAWLFLTACWTVEALTFGFASSFGVYHDFYSNHAPFASSGNIAVIGTTTSGIMYLGTPLVLIICRLYPRWARWCTLVGVSVASLSLTASSLCNSVPQLIVAQGIWFGIGSCFAYSPSTLYINEWFVRRKGLAYGIVWSAAGFGGVVLPLILETLLNSLGFQTATRIWAAIFFVCSVPMAFFVKPRMPISASPPTTPFSMRFVTSKPFVTHQVVNFIQATGFFLPGIYLPTYARVAFGASTFLSALTVILLNLASAIGLVIMGLLSDRLAVSTCMIISAAGATISVLVIWGLAPSLPVLYLFCVLYGLFAGSWPSIWPGIMEQVSQSGDTGGYGNVDPVMVQGQLCVSRGIGNIASGPLSNWLVKDMLWKGQAIAGYGSGYGMLILYTGITALLSGVNLLFKRLCSDA